MNPEPFTEKELDVIRMRAMYLARKKDCGVLLQRKFWALADAVNNLSTGTTMSEFVPEEKKMKSDLSKLAEGHGKDYSSVGGVEGQKEPNQ